MEKENLDVVRGEYVDVDGVGNRLKTPDLSAEKLKDKVFGSY